MNLKIVLLILTLITVNKIMAQTTGTLQVSTTTKSAGGNFAPKNIVAVWVENENGQFVKTLAAYANARKTYLNTWEALTSSAGSIYNTVDAVTGATRSSHGTINCSWNGTDYKGNLVGDGTYNLRFELTDKNSTGNRASFLFSKGNAIQTLTPANVPSFESTSIKWEPIVLTGIETKTQQKDVGITFDPSSGQLSVLGGIVQSLEIYNQAGQLIFKKQASVANITNFQNGAYIIVVKTNNGYLSRKIIKVGE
jgi:hypothetical protein